MRYRPQRLPGPQARRPHRDLRRARDRPRLTRAPSGAPMAADRVGRMADLEFFFDPCARGRGSRRAGSTEVQQQRDYDGQLAVHLVEDDQRGPHGRLVHARVPGRRTWPACTRTACADEVRLQHGNDRRRGAVHGARRSRSTASSVAPRSTTTRSAFMAEMLDDGGPAHRPRRRTRTTSRTTRTSAPRPSWRSAAPATTSARRSSRSTRAEPTRPASSVRSSPRSRAATRPLRLWDAIEVIATTSGMAELKRSNRARRSTDASSTEPPSKPDRRPRPRR